MFRFFGLYFSDRFQIVLVRTYFRFGDAFTVGSFTKWLLCFHYNNSSDSNIFYFTNVCEISSYIPLCISLLLLPPFSGLVQVFFQLVLQLVALIDGRRRHLLVRVLRGRLDRLIPFINSARARLFDRFLCGLTRLLLASALIFARRRIA